MNQNPGGKKKCKILIIGVGSPLRRDDAAALYLIKELEKRGYHCILNCPMGIELCTHHVSETKPDLLIIVDAAIGIDPGSVIVLEKPPPISIMTTHNIDPPLLHRYLSSYTNKIVYVLLGVSDIGFGEGFSKEALEAIKRAINVIEHMIRGQILIEDQGNYLA